MLWFRTPEKVYFKKGCLPVALDELKNSNGQEEGIYRNRRIPVTEADMTNPITDKLDEMGIQHACFYEVAPDPTLQMRKKRSGSAESIWSQM